MNIKERISERISLCQVRELCLWAQKDQDRMDELYRLSHDVSDRIAVNALWILTHADMNDVSNMAWLETKREDLIYYIMRETVTSKLRLMLHLLMHLQVKPSDVRPDFIDFCIQKITDTSQPYAIRSSCIKLAYEQMHHYPELLQELVCILDILTQEALSPGLDSARRQVLKKISKGRKTE